MEVYAMTSDMLMNCPEKKICWGHKIFMVYYIYHTGLCSFFIVVSLI